MNAIDWGRLVLLLIIWVVLAEVLGDLVPGLPFRRRISIAFSLLGCIFGVVIVMSGVAP